MHEAAIRAHQQANVRIVGIVAAATSAVVDRQRLRVQRVCEQPGPRGDAVVLQAAGELEDVDGPVPIRNRGTGVGCRRSRGRPGCGDFRPQARGRRVVRVERHEAVGGIAGVEGEQLPSARVGIRRARPTGDVSGHHLSGAASRHRASVGPRDLVVDGWRQGGDVGPEGDGVALDAAIDVNGVDSVDVLKLGIPGRCILPDAQLLQVAVPERKRVLIGLEKRHEDLVDDLGAVEDVDRHRRRHEGRADAQDASENVVERVDQLFGVAAERQRDTGASRARITVRGRVDLVWIDDEVRGHVLQAAEIRHGAEGAVTEVRISQVTNHGGEVVVLSGEVDAFHASIGLVCLVRRNGSIRIVLLVGDLEEQVDDENFGALAKSRNGARVGGSRDVLDVGVP